MRLLKCPQCGISNFYLKDAQGNRFNVKVGDDGKLISVNGENIPDDFDINVLYCMGCSWHGTKNKLIKY